MTDVQSTLDEVFMPEWIGTFLIAIHCLDLVVAITKLQPDVLHCQYA